MDIRHQHDETAGTETARPLGVGRDDEAIAGLELFSEPLRDV